MKTAAKADQKADQTGARPAVRHGPDRPRRGAASYGASEVSGLLQDVPATRYGSCNPRNYCTVSTDTQGAPAGKEGQRREFASHVLYIGILTSWSTDAARFASQRAQMHDMPLGLSQRVLQVQGEDTFTQPPDGTPLSSSSRAMHMCPYPD